MRIVDTFIQRHREKKLRANPNLKITKSTTISSHASLRFGKLGVIKIGENSFVNEFCAINTCNSSIEIGDNVLIGPATVINTINHRFERTDIPILEQGLNEKPIQIENDTWIGAHCTIIGGAKIGAHSIIGAHSLVTKDIPPYSIAYGIPCKVIKTREPQKEHTSDDYVENEELSTIEGPLLQNRTCYKTNKRVNV